MGRVTSYGTKGTELAATLVRRNYRLDASKPAVIFCHGLNGQAWHPVNYPDPVLDELAQRGFPIMSPDLGGVATWGNTASQTKLADARAYMQASMGAKAGGVLLWAGSMGTLTALNFLRNNPTLVLGMAAGLPAVDLADLHDNAVARGITEASIDTAYANHAGYVAALPTHNPSQGDFAAVADKIRLWYSTDDPTTIPARVTAFAAASGATAVSMGATGGHVFDADFAIDVCDYLESLI